MSGAKILYIGFGELMNSVESRLSASPGVAFREILQLSSDVQENLLEDGDIFLVGPYTLDPVKQVQRAAQQNPAISIIVLIFPDQYQKIKQSVQFAYNVGKHVTFVSYELGKDITAVFDSAIRRTQQRKNFSKLTEQQVYPKAENPAITYRNLGSFLEHAPIGAIVFDSEKLVSQANHRARQMFYPKLEKTSGLSWNELFPEFEPQAETGEEPVNEVVKVNNHFLEINISPLNVEDGKAHYLLLLNDVTDKIQAENKLQSKVAELEFLNMELDQFVNVVSHDFKTPLTSISLLAQLGVKTDDPEKQKTFLQQILHSADKLKELLKGLNVLVDVTKTRSEKAEPVNFQERLTLALTDYSDALKEREGQVTADFNAAPDVLYFTAHIDSLLGNLITNAIKYHQSGVPLKIEVKTRREKDYTVLSVKDNGIGIDLSKNMNKLFQPFKRLTDQGTGSGLGLSIVKRVIEKNQGYLEVFSQPGQGTEFKAYLKSPQ